jgi:RNA polymerase sigma factor (sigma-70 family)
MTVDDDGLAQQFEAQRGHLRAVAYRMLGSLSEADDAVQEAWLRLSRTDASGQDVQNLAGWLTTVVGRICLDMLRSRTARREDALDTHVPDPVVSGPDGTDPEYQAVQADSVGLALLVVLDTLAPAERLAFVLHDLFGVPFDDIAPIVGRTSNTAAQLASRARRRVRGAAMPDPDLGRQRQVVDAFLAASRAGDFEALLALLDPDVLLRPDRGAAAVTELIRGAQNVARTALMFAQAAMTPNRVLVNGGLGVLSTSDGRPVSLLAFTISGGRIVEIDIVADPKRLAALALPQPPMR